MTNSRSWVFLQLSFGLSLIACLGSLFFSNVMKLPPCELCWYQRIAMFPIPVIIAVGIFIKDKKCAIYSLILGMIGFLTSLYHNLLYWKIIPESISPCTADLSCTSKQIEILGFITIPLMSLAVFSTIIFLIFRFLKSIKQDWLT